MKKPCTNCSNSFEYKTRQKVVRECDPFKQECLQCDKHKKYLEFRESKRMYTQGHVIESLDEFDHCIAEDSFVYFRDKISHAGWMMSLQYRLIRDAISRGFIRTAIKKE